MSARLEDPGPPTMDTFEIRKRRPRRKRWRVVYRDVNGTELDRQSFWFRFQAVGVALQLNARAKEVADDLRRVVPAGDRERLAPQLFTAAVERDT